MPFKLYSFKNYTNTFENVGIGVAYASTFKSAGIDLLNYIHSRPIPVPSIGSTHSSTFKSARMGLIHISVNAILTQVKMSEQGLKSVGTYLGAFEKHWCRSGDLILTVTMQ